MVDIRSVGHRLDDLQVDLLGVVRPALTLGGDANASWMSAFCSGCKGPRSAGSADEGSGPFRAVLDQGSRKPDGPPGDWHPLTDASKSTTMPKRCRAEQAFMELDPFGTICSIPWMQIRSTKSETVLGDSSRRSLRPGWRVPSSSTGSRSPALGSSGRGPPDWICFISSEFHTRVSSPNGAETVGTPITTCAGMPEVSSSFSTCRAASRVQLRFPRRRLDDQGVVRPHGKLAGQFA